MEEILEKCINDINGDDIINFMQTRSQKEKDEFREFLDSESGIKTNFFIIKHWFYDKYMPKKENNKIKFADKLKTLFE